MRRTAAVLVLLAVMGSGSAAAWGRGAKDPLISPITTDSRRDRSTVLTAPPELRGKALRAGAVTVTENGVAQKASVVRLPAERLEVVLVIDASSSMKGAALASAKAAAGDFIGRLPVHTQVALVAFGSTPVLASPLAADRNAVRSAVQGLRAGGGTSLYDAVRLATAQFSRDAAGRRSIVVLSDGRDTVSSLPLKATTDAITSTGAHVSVIELGTSRRDRVTLEKVAAAGGGQVAAAGDPSALAGAYKGIAASLANQYRVTWRSSSSGTADVAVRVHQDAVVAVSRSTIHRPVVPSAAPSSGSTRSRQAPSPAVHVAPWILVLGVGCLSVALLLSGLIAFAPRRRRAGLGSVHPSHNDASALKGVVRRATTSADAVLTRHGWRSSLNGRLEQAGLALRPGEYAVLSIAAMVLALALGAVVSGPLAGLLLAGVAGAIAHGTLGVMRSRRRRRFSDQLGDTLQQLAGSLRAGYGLLQAVDGLGRESLEPTSSEFRRIVVEARLGRDVSTSLHAMSERIGTDDFEWVVQAIDIHREVGGDLAEVLDTVAGTIRERNQVMRQVKSLTAEGRLSAYILLALPVLLAAALRLINPTYFVLLTSGPGLFLSGFAVVMIAIGALWFRKLCKLEY